MLPVPHDVREARDSGQGYDSRLTSMMSGIKFTVDRFIVTD